MIRWVHARLGTAPATSIELGSDLACVDVRDLVDKGGNNDRAVLRKIDEGVALLVEGRKVVICCDYGISRSNAVAAGILSRYEKIPFDQAVLQVSRSTGEQEIKLEPLNAVRRVLSTSRSYDLPHQAKKTLITGGSGFIGRSLACETARLGQSIFLDGAIDLAAGAVELDAIAQNNGVGQILHLASPRIYTSNRALGHTLTMLRNVLEVCRSTGAKLIFLSSWEVYSGYGADPIIANESLPSRPKGPYGETKLLCERLIEHHRAHHDLACTIIRSAPVYGTESDKPKFLHTFIQKTLDHAAKIVTHRYLNGLPALDLIHITDLVDLILKVVERPVTGDFNAGGGKLYDTAEIARLVARLCNVSIQIEQECIEDETAIVQMDSARAKKLLGWAPKTTLESELPRLLAIHKHRASINSL